MKTSKLNILILALCEALIGVLLLVNPVGFTRSIIIFVGVLLFLMGIVSVVQYFRATPVAAASGQKLSSGCLEILAGLLLMAKSSWFIAAFPLLTILYAIGVLVTGVTKLQRAVDQLRLKNKKWYWMAINAAVTLICSVIILCNPFGSTNVLWSFIAILLIVEAVVDGLTALFSKGDS